MIVCPNKECDNYNQELEGSIEVCPACGTKTAKAIAKTNSTLTIVAIIVAIVGFAYALTDLTFGNNIIIGLVVVAVSVVLGFISKSKLAIIIAILFLLGNAGLLMFYLFGG